MNNNILPAGWECVKFGDIADCISKRVEPSETDLDVYVGLEHLDSDSLKIKRYGKPSDVEGIKLYVQPGDIIFGKRRAYQRKLAIADFEGICSAHAMVLRAKEEKILRNLLPFFMQSHIFMDRAIAISEGSLSPTIKWKTLCKQEFPLPPAQEQKRISNILWAVEECIRKWEESLDKAKVYKKVLMKHLFTYGPVGFNEISNIRLKKTEVGMIPDIWNVKSICDVATIDYGISEAVSQNTDPSIGCPILTGANITLYGKLDLSKQVYIEPPKQERFFLKIGDLLFNWRSGSPEHVGKTAIFNLNGIYTYASFILRIRTSKELLTEFGYFLLNYMRSNKYLSRDMSQQVNFKMNAKIFREIKIPYPPLEEQQKIAHILSTLDKTIETAETHRKTLQSLKTRLLNDLLSGKKRLQ